MSMLATFARRSVIGPARRMAVAPVAVRSLSSAQDLEPPVELTKDGAIIVTDTAFTLEWVLTSPPPLHCFEEPPIMCEWPEGEAGGH